MSRRRERASATPPIASPDWVGLLSTVGLIAIAFAYCIYFYDDDRRQLIWSQLLWPDELLTSSWGGDLRFFGVFDRAPLLLWAAGILAAAAALGRGTLRGLQLQTLFPRWELNTYAVAVGLAWLSLVTLLVGRVGMLPCGNVEATGSRSQSSRASF